MCRKPGDNTECSNFYTRAPDINQGFMSTDVPCIDDPLNPQNNVGKSSFHFKDIQKIFKVGYQSAFLGCFCDCHFSRQGQFCLDYVVQDPSTPFHPVYTPSLSEAIPQIQYQDERGQTLAIGVESLYVQERIAPDEKCDSILTKIIYS